MKKIKIILLALVAFGASSLFSSCTSTVTGDFNYSYSIESASSSVTMMFMAKYDATLDEFIRKAGGKRIEAHSGYSYYFTGEEKECRKAAIQVIKDFLAFVESPEQLGTGSVYADNNLCVVLQKALPAGSTESAEVYRQKLR